MSQVSVALKTILFTTLCFLLASDTTLSAGKNKKKKGKKEIIENFDVSSLGEYSSTSPDQCPKTDKIITRLADRLMANPNSLEGTTKSGLLGLLATGEAKYLSFVFKYIKERLKEQPKGEFLKSKNSTGWNWGYEAILLAEYYCLTQDKEALAPLKSYSLSLSKGQDSAGMWGHAMARPIINRVPGYGQMNQPTLSNFLALVMAKKCGINDPILNSAIEKSRKYARHHVWEGSFPYGFHGPSGGSYNNNGTSGSAAVAFSLLGDSEAASYFSQCAALGHDQLTSGHASKFFNPLWTPLGAHLSGPEVFQQFYQKSQWYFKIGTESTMGNGDSDKEGSNMGAQLLFRAASRRNLMITGREGDESIWVKGKKAVSEVMSRDACVNQEMSHEKLIDFFKNPFPQVRSKAREYLRKKYKLPTGPKGKKRYLQNKDYYDNGRKGIHEILLSILKDKSLLPHERQSAIIHYHNTPIPQDIEHELIRILKDSEERITLRCDTAPTLRERRDYFNDFMNLLLKEKPEDPYGYADITIGQVFIDDQKKFMKERHQNPSSELEGEIHSRQAWMNAVIQNKPLYYQCVNKLLQHPRQTGRGVAIGMLKGIHFADYHFIADPLEHVLQDQDPTYHTYHNPGIALGPGIDLYTKFNIEEGLNHLESLVRARTGKWSFKLKTFLSVIPKYGPRGAVVMERLIADHKYMKSSFEKPDGKIKGFLNKLKTQTHSPTLITVTEAKKMSLRISNP